MNLFKLLLLALVCLCIGHLAGALQALVQALIAP
jgi:hypothetical protein